MGGRRARRCRRWVALALALQSYGCGTAANADEGSSVAPVLECSVPYEDVYPARCSDRLLRASDFDGCVPASEFEEWGCLLLDRDARLCDESQPYFMTVLLEESDVRLDCAGATIDHGWVDGEPPRPGIRTSKTRSLANITVENCRIENTGFAAVELQRYFRGEEVHGPLEGHAHIELRNLAIDNARYGVYLGVASRSVTLEDVRVRRSRNVGIYIEAWSVGTTLRRVAVEDTARREGLAIDSATHTLVEDSHFRRNAGGAVQLYRNCGEIRGTVCPIERTLGASWNVFRGNVFEDRVVVASRQGKSYPDGYCLDLEGRAGRGRDDSRFNTFFENILVGNDSRPLLDVRDGPNRIERNRFTRRASNCIGLRLSTGEVRGFASASSMSETELVQNEFLECELRLEHGLAGVVSVR